MSNHGFLASHAVNVKLVQLSQSSKPLIQLMNLKVPPEPNTLVRGVPYGRALERAHCIETVLELSEVCNCSFTRNLNHNSNIINIS